MASLEKLIMSKQDQAIEASVVRFKRVIDLSVPLDPRTVWMREDIPNPAEKGSGMWGKDMEARPWLDTLSIRRWLEPPPYSGLLEDITIWAHTGTHVDSAYQNDPKGDCLTDMPLDRFVGEAVALDLSFVGPGKAFVQGDYSGGKEITVADLKKFADKIKAEDFVFLYTKYESNEAPMIPYEAAQWLIKRKIKGIGFGGESIHQSLRAHDAFHRSNLPIIDRLDIKGLKSISDKRIFVVLFPLRIAYLSTSPCRVVGFVE